MIRALIAATLVALVAAAPAHAATPPPGRELTSARAIAIATDAVRDGLAEHPRARPRVTLGSEGRWRVRFVEPGERVAVAEVVVEDRSGRVRERWTGIQAEWSMARGIPGAFGGVAGALWVWLPLCALFLAPFARPPLRLVHLDLAVLLALGVSWAAFARGNVELAVPLAYPPLVYLLLRLLHVARRGPGPPPRTWGSATLLGVGAAFLLGVRDGLAIAGGNVIDVGYASVVGADRLLTGPGLYGAFPLDIARGDTYGPVLYALYVPFELAWPWSGSWDAVPAARAAALVWDAACAGGLWLLGRRLGGPRLGGLLAWAWVTFPFTLIVAASGANDALVGALVVAALLTLGRPAARGALGALAGLTKLAPLGLLPLLVRGTSGGPAPRGTEGAPGGAGGRAPSSTDRRGMLRAAGAAGLVLGAAALALAVRGELGLAWERTVAFQADRESPFSVWGLYGGLEPLQAAVQAGAVALAVAVAFVPRRRDVPTVAALAAAVLIAAQLGADHWFHLYLVWFLPAALVALLAPRQEAGRSTGSMLAARPPSVVEMTTAFSHGSSSEAS